MKLYPTAVALGISSALLQGAFAADAATSADAALGLVTVTAQSRTQQVQDVPIAMQIISSEQIGKLAAPNLAAMNGYIPGLDVSGEQPTQPGISLRGIGTGDFGIGADSPVGVYVDGIYTGKTGGALMNFNDTQRIEVLKGPQGTLFGRNSAGGAVSVVTKEPSDELEAEVRMRAAQYGGRYIDALLNVPLSDTLAFRMTLVNDQSTGYFHDAATGEQLDGRSDWGTRMTLRWNAPAQTKVLLSWEHEKLDQKARPAIGIVAIPASGTANWPADPNTYLDPRTAPIYNDSLGNRETRNFDGVTLRIEKPLGWATFNSTTGYRKFDTYNREEYDGTNKITTYVDTANIEENTSWQQEFKLTGKTDAVDWLAGVSAFKENAKQTSQFNTYTDTLDNLFTHIAGVPVYTTIDQLAQAFGVPAQIFGNTWGKRMYNEGNYTATAVYGDAIWHLTPKTNLTTGIRFTHDEKEFSWFAPNRVAPGLDAALNTLNQADVFNTAVGLGLLSAQDAALLQGVAQTNIEWNDPLSATAPYTVKQSWNDVSPRIVLDHKLTPDALVYGSVTKGYQSGGFNALSGVGISYQPETVVNYEVGV